MMERATAIFVDGIGTAAATSGVLNQFQGRIFALLYLQPDPMTLEDIAAELQQSKSNVSVNIRGLVDWHLVHAVQVAGSRKDHYQAATDLVRVMQEISERRFRWNMRQVMTAASETARALDAEKLAANKKHVAFMHQRLDALRSFFTLLDSMIGMFGPGKPFPPATVESTAERVGRKAK